MSKGGRKLQSRMLGWETELFMGRCEDVKREGECDRGQEREMRRRLSL